MIMAILYYIFTKDNGINYDIMSIFDLLLVIVLLINTFLLDCML